MSVCLLVHVLNRYRSVGQRENRLSRSGWGWVVVRWRYRKWGEISLITLLIQRVYNIRPTYHHPISHVDLFSPKWNFSFITKRCSLYIYYIEHVSRKRYGRKKKTQSFMKNSLESFCRINLRRNLFCREFFLNGYKLQGVKFS